jgi:hypothetical protein
VLKNGELQQVSFSIFTLAERHVSELPIGPPWDHSSSDDLIDVIINIIIAALLEGVLRSGIPVVRGPRTLDSIYVVP